MTTPGDGNEIEFRTRIVPGGDERDVARRVGQDAGEAYGEGVRQAGAVQLPPIDVNRMYDEIDSSLTRLEQRISTSARNMGIRLQEAMGGQQRLGGQDLTAEWERYARDLENLGGRTNSTFIGSLADAVRADARRLEQGFDYASEVNRRGKSINWALNYEGRQALAMQGQSYDPGPGTDSFYRGSTFPTPPSAAPVGDAEQGAGDLDRVRARAMAEINRITLDDATYALENGQFFKVNARGAVQRGQGAIDNPELLARLQSQTVAQVRQAEDQIVRETLADLGRRNPAFADLGIRDLGAEYAYGQAQQAELDVARRDVEAVEAKINRLREQVGSEHQFKPTAGQARQTALWDLARFAYRNETPQITPDMASARQSERIYNGLQARPFEPGRLAREAEVLRQGIGDTFTRLEGEVGEARSRFAELARGGRLPATDVAEMVQSDIRSAPGLAGLDRAIGTLNSLGVQAPEIFDALRTQMVQIIDAEERAATAAQRQARATREASEEAARLAATLNRLEEAFEGFVDPEQRRRNENDRLGAGLVQQAQERAFTPYAAELTTQAGGRGGPPEPPRPPAPPSSQGDDDAADEDFYRRALARRRAIDEDFIQETIGRQLIVRAQARAYDTYQPNIEATGTDLEREQNRLDQIRQERAARRETVGQMPLAQFAARESGYEEAQRVRRALDDLGVGLERASASLPKTREERERPLTLAERLDPSPPDPRAERPQRRDLTLAERLGTVDPRRQEAIDAQRVDLSDLQTLKFGIEDLGRSTRATIASTADLSAAQQRLQGVQRVAQRAGEQVPLGEVRGLYEGARLGPGAPVVRTADDGFAEVTRTGKLRAITEAEALSRAEVELAANIRAEGRAANLNTAQIEEWTDAERRLFLALQAKDKALSSGNLEDYARALNRVSTAQAGVDKSDRQPGQIGGFVQSTMRGLTMARGANQGDNNAFLRLRAESGEFLGAIARYQVAYAAIFGLSQGFVALVSSEVQAQDVMIEFAHATGLAGDEANRLGNELGILGGKAGYSVAQSLQAATRGVFAFQQDIREGALAPDVAAQSVRQAGNLSLIAPTLDPNQAQTQLIAATNGFQLGVDGQARVLDAATNAYRNYGGAVEEVIAALPTLSEVARDAGLSVEEMSNLVSVGVARTAMNGTGIASLLNRVFGNLNAKPEVRGMLESLGIEADGSAGEVVYNLAAAWEDLGKAQRDQIVSALGGHETARALLPILSEGTELLDANARSFEGLGAAQDLVNEKSENLAGLVRNLLGDFQNFGRALFDSGIFDLAMVGLAALSPFMEGFNSLLRLVSQLPGSTESWLFALLQVAGILTIIGKQYQSNLLAAQATAAAAGTQAVASGAGAIGAGAAAGVGVAASARAAGGTLVAGLRSLLTGTSGAAIGLVALTVAAGGTVEALRNIREAATGVRAAQRGAAEAQTPDELRASASALANADAVRRDAEGGFFGWIGRQLESRTLDEQAPPKPDEKDEGEVTPLERQSRFALNLADQIEAEAEALNATSSPLGAFFSNTGRFAEDMTQGLQAMQLAGLPAVDMLDNLTAALRQATNAEPASGVFANAGTVGNLATVTTGVVQGFEFEAKDINDPMGAGDWTQAILGSPFGVGTFTKDARRTKEALQAFDPTEVQELIQGMLAERNLGPGDIIDDATQTEITNAVVNSLGLEEFLTGDARSRLGKEVRAALRSRFSETQQTAVAGLESQGDVNDYIFGPEIEGRRDGGQLQAILGNRAGVDPRQLDSEEQLLTAQADNLRTLMESIEDRGLNAPIQLTDALAEVEHSLAEVVVARLDRLREAALATTTDDAAEARINADSVSQQVEVAINASDPTVLLGVMDNATDEALTAVRALLATAVQVAEAAYEEARRLIDEAASLGGEVNASDRGLMNRARDGALAGVSEKVSEARSALQMFDDVKARRVPAGAKKDDDDDARQEELARIQAEAVAGDPVSGARAALKAAAYARDTAKDETARYQAIRQYKDAQQQLTEALAAQSQAQITGAVAPGNDLGAAAAKIRAAEVAVGAAVRGTAAWSNAQAALEQARYDYGQAANAQSAARAAAQVRPGDELGAARAAVDAAATELRTSFRGSVEYWAAYGQLQQAQYDYAQTLMTTNQQRRLRTVDLTDPVAVARAEQQSANERLRFAQANGGNSDEEYNAARSAAAQAEAAAFDQRLSDTEYAKNMGQISDTAYIQFLESESSRLRAIGNRTRQQTEQMQQIDQALKAAADEMQGQWNIGDINIPTPYEARRFIATQAAGMDYQGGTTSNTQNVDIVINGMDRAEVITVLDRYFGQQTTQRATTTTRKV